MGIASKNTTETVVDSMTVHVNGKATKLPEGSTIEKLILTLNLGKQRCAVEVNQRLIRRDWYSSHELHTDDQVEVVTLVGGG